MPSQSEVLLDQVLRLATVTCDPRFRKAARVDAVRALSRLGWEHPAIPQQLPPGAIQQWPELGAKTVLGLPCNSPAALADVPADIQLLLLGVRPLVLIHGPEAYVSAISAYARARGLQVIFSPFEFVPDTDESLGGYSNRCSELRPARPGSGSWRSLLVSPSSITLSLGWLALCQGWDELLGRLLGYPLCCVRSFITRWPTACSDFDGDVALLLLAEEPSDRSFPWESNVFGRYFGATLLPHFPCHFDCAASLAQARRTELALTMTQPSLLATIKNVSQSVVIFAGQEGLALIPEGRLSREGTQTRLRWSPIQVHSTVAGGRLGAALRDVAEACYEEGALTLDGLRLPATILDFSETSKTLT
jgi:hypothetical protein